MTAPKIKITKVDPPSGPCVGGTPVTITVKGDDLDKDTFEGIKVVKFGKNPATDPQLGWDDHEKKGEIKVKSPAGPLEKVEVIVFTPGGYQVKDAFTYTDGQEKAQPYTPARRKMDAVRTKSRRRTKK